MTRRAGLALTLCLAGTLGVGGCAGGSGHSPATSPAPATHPGTAGSPGPTVVSTPDTPPAADTSSVAASSGPNDAALHQAVLRASDFPSGWSGAAYKPSADDAKDNAGLASCAGFSDTFPERVVDVHGETFTKGDDTVSSEAFTLPSAAAVQADVAALSLPKYASCERKVLIAEATKALPAGEKILSSSTVSVQPRTKSDPPDVAGYLSLSVALSTPGGDHTVDQDGVLLAHGNVEAEVDFTGIDKDFPTAIEAPLTAALYQRVAQLG